jgi:DNA invertase Pin-like site-specific DNA recombinase
MKPSPTLTLRAVLFLRVNDGAQPTKELFKEQENACRSYCEANDYEVVRVFREEGPASAASRPEFQKMIAFCSSKEANIQYVVVSDFTRWSRRMDEVVSSIQLLSRSGVAVRSAQGVKVPGFARAALGAMQSARKLKAFKRGRGSKHGS